MNLQFRQFGHAGIRIWNAISTKVVVIKLTARTRRSMKYFKISSQSKEYLLNQLIL